VDAAAVLARVAGGEDERTELERGLGDPAAIGRAICSFANTVGGLLVVGVADDGQVVGVAEDEGRVQERLTSFLQTGLSAPVTAHLRHARTPAGVVHWVEVPRQRGFEPLRSRGVVYVRRGRASVEPSPTEMQELYNAFGLHLTEERYVAGTGLSRLDPDAFRLFLRRLGLDTESEPQPSPEDDLRNRGALTIVEPDTFATLFGLLAFGRDPQGHPQTRNLCMACTAYAGTDRADEAISTSEALGRLDEQVSRALGWMKSLGWSERYEGIVRRDVPLVPERALREALVNAVAHRDYAITGTRVLLDVFADRVEVTSPGTLPNHLSPESVRAGGRPRSRNEMMAFFLQTMGFMEQRGRGWALMRRAMLDAGGSEPVLEHDEVARFVRVTLRRTP
jgi:ATP-dependent DNA helicase RecG